MAGKIKASTLAAGQLLANYAEKAITGVINLAKAGMEYNQQMEDYTTNFTVMLGDAGKAAQKVQELKEFAASTPFTMEDLAKSTQTLLAFGVANENTQEIMKELGDISLGNADKFNRLSTAYGKANSMGKLTGETVQQMIEAGFNPLLLISQKTGESMADLQKRMAAGKIGVDELDEALKTATSTGGQFNDGMKQASQTTSGLISTLKDNFTAMLGKLSQGFSNVLKDTVLPKLIGMVEKLTGYIDDNADRFEKFGDKLGDFVDNALDKLMEGIEWLIENGGDLFDVFTSVMNIIGKLASAALPAMLNVLPKIANAFAGIIDKVMPLIENLVNGFAAAITWITDNADTLIPILEGVAGAILLWNGYQTILNITMAANPIGAVISAVAMLAGGIMILIDAFNGGDTAIKNYKETMKNSISGITDFRDAVDGLEPTLTNVNDLLSSNGNSVSDLNSSIEQAETAITDILKTALSEHRQLRQDELDDIRQYNQDIANLNQEKIQMYRDQQIAEMRKVMLEEGEMTQEQAEQRLKNIETSFDSVNNITEQAYSAQLSTIENFHRTQGTLDSEAYKQDQQAAKDAYEAQLAQNKTYRDQSVASILKSSAEWVAADQAKWDALAGAQDDYNTEHDRLWQDFVTNGNVNAKALKTNNNTVATEYSNTLDGMMLDNANAFLTMYADAKQAGVDIPDEISTMVSNILDKFSGLPEDMQDEGKDALNGILGGIKDKAIRSDIEKAAEGTADDVVDTIKTAWDINSPSRVGKGLTENFMSGLEGGLTGKRQSLLSVAGSIANDLINSFLSLFGINRSTNSRGQTTYSIPRHDSGIERVPYDGYLASLDMGERVQTRAEVDAENVQKKSGGIDTAEIAAAVSAAIKEAMDGVGMYLDGKRVGKLVAAGVSDALSNNANSFLRSGYNGQA